MAINLVTLLNTNEFFEDDTLVVDHLQAENVLERPQRLRLQQHLKHFFFEQMAVFLVSHKLNVILDLVIHDLQVGRGDLASVKTASKQPQTPLMFLVWSQTPQISADLK